MSANKGNSDTLYSPASPEAEIWIPARLGSTRLKEKLLRNVRGRPVLAYTLDSAIEAAELLDYGPEKVRLVTDNETMAQIALAAGAQLTYVRAPCSSGTERLARAMRDLSVGTQPDIVINLQGDEPMMPPEVLASLARWMLERPEIEMGTMMRPGEVEEGEVSVVLDRNDRALYFSRQRLPGSHPTQNQISTDQRAPSWGSHVGVYGYRRKVLQEWLDWTSGPLEAREGLEQLRALEYGIAIAVLRIEENRATRPLLPGECHTVRRSWFSIDTENDLRRFEALI